MEESGRVDRLSRLGQGVAAVPPGIKHTFWGGTVTATKASNFGNRATAILLAGTMLSAVPLAAHAQTAQQTPPAAATDAAPAAPPAIDAAQAAAAVSAPAQQRTITSIRVDGSQRIEPATVLSYTKLQVGQPLSNPLLDQALRDLLNSGLFADVAIDGAQTGELVIRIKENPLINRVILEGNKHLKSDKITKEIKLAPRQIFTRTAVRQDVTRIIELYRREGRFAANVQPQMVALDQNRVDVVFEISEGPKSKVRQINIIGNEEFSDGKLRKQMATKEARLLTILSSNTSYDQDRMAYDQQKLRQFYLTEGYADFRVTSAVAELTPDKRDFIITYVVEEGPRYKFGDVTVDSDIRDFNGERLAAALPFHKGDWYNAKAVEDSIDSLKETAGLVGYAFAEVEPDFHRDRDNLTMGINFHIAQSQRTYVERIDINGNTNTQDKVIRREMRLAEGDAFNSFQVKRSQDRINSLGFFQDKFEIKQSPGSAPDRLVLEANVEERSTGEIQLSAGYSSLERFIIQAGITQRNFRGKGQELRASVNYSSYSKSVQLGFTEPYLFDKSVAVGADIFRRDYNAFNYLGRDRQTTYSQVSTGFQLRAGIPLTEYWSLAGRYQLSYDEVGLDEQFFSDGECDPLKAGRYLCDSLGDRLTSSIGYSLINDSLNSRLRPSAGNRLVFSQDFAGLGGDVKYVRYLGEPQFRGFDIRGVGPRVQRIPYTTDADGNQTLVTDKDRIYDDALGGKAYYLGHAELEIPLGSGAQELGLRPSIFMDFGALFDVKKPLPTAVFPTHTDADGNVIVDPIINPVYDGEGNPLFIVPTDAADNAGKITTCQTGYADTFGGTCSGSSANTAYTTSVAPFAERYYGFSWKPRLSVGFGVNWNSPFGPLRIDIAKALLSRPGEDKKLITFNVGGQF